MFEVLTAAITDGIKDTALCIPILYVTYLFMEILESSSRFDEETLCRYSRKVGPVIGGVIGVIPQCGLAGSAAALYSTGTVTLGTMLAVFFATSDEMLPVMLASLSGKFAIGVGAMFGILAAKAGLGIILGYIADIAVKAGKGKNIHALCERDHCECDGEEGSVYRSALIHTAKITLMLLIVNVVLSAAIGCVGIESLSGTIINQPVIGELIVGLFGLIPNCAIISNRRRRFTVSENPTMLCIPNLAKRRLIWQKAYIGQLTPFCILWRNMLENAPTNPFWPTLL